MVVPASFIAARLMSKGIFSSTMSTAIVALRLPKYTGRMTSSLDLYILPEEDTFPLKPKSEAVKNCKFLIMVHTLPDFFEARMGIRNSYGQYISEKLAGNTSLLFIIGNLKTSNKTKYELTWNKLKKEQEHFGDILQVFYCHRCLVQRFIQYTYLSVPSLI